MQPRGDRPLGLVPFAWQLLHTDTAIDTPCWAIDTPDELHTRLLGD
jgi:hypothetical protein